MALAASPVDQARPGENLSLHEGRKCRGRPGQAGTGSGHERARIPDAIGRFTLVVGAGAAEPGGLAPATSEEGSRGDGRSMGGTRGARHGSGRRRRDRIRDRSPPRPRWRNSRHIVDDGPDPRPGARTRVRGRRRLRPRRGPHASRRGPAPDRRGHRATRSAPGHPRQQRRHDRRRRGARVEHVRIHVRLRVGTRHRPEPGHPVRRDTRRAARRPGIRERADPSSSRR